MLATETTKQILIVDRDVATVEPLRQRLGEVGFVVRAITDGAAAVTAVAERPPHLLIIDWNIPGFAALDVIQRLRKVRAPQTIRLIILSALSGEEHVVTGLNLGADDYITKPFATRELIARVKAVLRRFERPTAPSIISFEEVLIDAGAMQLKVRGELTTTTATEFRLLDYLARHPGRVFSRDHLLDAVWGDARFVTPRSVDVYVRRIREKIETDPESPRYLKTVRGAGYRFEIPRVVEEPHKSAS